MNDVDTVESNSATSSLVSNNNESASNATEDTHIPASKSPRHSSKNKRSERTINLILKATERVILESGTSRITIHDVCKYAGISRGTFYRYFSAQDDLLEAFSRHKRDHFHSSMSNILEPVNDPDEKFAKLVEYLDNYLESGQARRLLAVAPDYALRWFESIFQDSIQCFEKDLTIVFDNWDNKLGVKLDRELICELIVRYILSEQLVPTGKLRRSMPLRIGVLIQSIIVGTMRKI